MEEAKQIFRKVSLRFSKKNIKLTRHKLKFGKEVDFAGTHIGELEGYYPTTAKINSIVELTPPSNLNELWSFLEFWHHLSGTKYYRKSLRKSKTYSYVYLVCSHSIKSEREYHIYYSLKGD